MPAPRIAAIALLASLALGATAAAQTATSGDASKEQTVQDLALPAPVTEEEAPAPAPAPAPASSGGTGTTTDEAPPGSETTGTDDGTATGTVTPGSQLDRPVTKSQTGGVAGSQTASQRKREYLESCAGDKALWPVSPLAAIAGSNVTDRQDRWPLYLLVAAVLILVAAFAERQRRRRGTSESPGMSNLEAGATIVGIAVALPGIAGLFFPGIGSQHHPPARATMVVREVQARITRGEFIKRAIPPAQRPNLRHSFDRQEIGDVIWLQVGLEGFRGDALTLTWASYSRPGGYSLIPMTDDALQVQVGRHSDAETRFVPIWVGLPKYPFQVRFRLIDDDRELREVARTGDMRGSQLRYVCAQART
jgi:hypothetical protein